jgi:hypothetical protein
MHAIGYLGRKLPMKKGKQYLVGLKEAPTIEPKQGGWAQIRYPDNTIAVSPVVSTQSPWAKSVHIFALQDGPDPVADRDKLVYRNSQGDGQSRVIVSFSLLE